MSWICQSHLPEDMQVLRALPGIQPLDMASWLHVDDAYAAQMKERADLMQSHFADICERMTGSEVAVHEAKELVVKHVQHLDGFERIGDHMRCPDGRLVALGDDPMVVMGELVQEDMCILEKPEGQDEHVLTAALLCFPAHWTLSEKIGHPMGRIHKPVVGYAGDIQRRVQRLFDGVKAGRPLWRFNRAYAGPKLYQPRLEQDFAEQETGNNNGYLRAERQSLIRLPKSDAVLFSIHTYVIAPENHKTPS